MSLQNNSIFRKLQKKNASVALFCIFVTCYSCSYWSIGGYYATKEDFLKKYANQNCFDEKEFAERVDEIRSSLIGDLGSARYSKIVEKFPDCFSLNCKLLSLLYTHVYENQYCVYCPNCYTNLNNKDNLGLERCSAYRYFSYSKFLSSIEHESNLVFFKYLRQQRTASNVKNSSIKFSEKSDITISTNNITQDCNEIGYFDKSNLAYLYYMYIDFKENNPNSIYLDNQIRRYATILFLELLLDDGDEYEDIFLQEIMNTLEGIMSIDLAWLVIDFEKGSLKFLLLVLLLNKKLSSELEKPETGFSEKNSSISCKFTPYKHFRHEVSSLINIFNQLSDNVILNSMNNNPSNSSLSSFLVREGIDENELDSLYGKNSTADEKMEFGLEPKFNTNVSQISFSEQCDMSYSKDSAESISNSRHFLTKLGGKTKIAQEAKYNCKASKNLNLDPINFIEHVFNTLNINENIQAAYKIVISKCFDSHYDNLEKEKYDKKKLSFLTIKDSKDTLSLIEKEPNCFSGRYLEGIGYTTRGVFNEVNSFEEKSSTGLEIDSHNKNHIKNIENSAYNLAIKKSRKKILTVLSTKNKEKYGAFNNEKFNKEFRDKKINEQKLGIAISNNQKSETSIPNIKLVQTLYENDTSYNNRADTPINKIIEHEKKLKDSKIYRTPEKQKKYIDHLSICPLVKSCYEKKTSNKCEQKNLNISDRKCYSESKKKIKIMTPKKNISILTEPKEKECDLNDGGWVSLSLQI